MDVCIKVIVVTIAILNTVTARSFHSDRFKRHYEDYEYDQSQSNDESFESSEKFKEMGHSPEEHHHGHPSSEYEYMSHDHHHKPTDIEDSKRQGGEFWNNKQGLNNNNNRRAWESNSMFTEPNNNGFTMPWSVNNVRPSAPTPPASSRTTPSPLTILVCTRSCQVTSEYNPVCGTNNVTYSNPGRLECAQNCGVDVRLLRPLPCSRPAPPTTNVGPTNPTPVTPPTPNTPRQTVKPTRYTTIDVNQGSTISPDLLASIFTGPSATEDGEYIDIRQERKGQLK